MPGSSMARLLCLAHRWRGVGAAEREVIFVQQGISRFGSNVARRFDVEGIVARRRCSADILTTRQERAAHQAKMLGRDRISLCGTCV